MPKFFCNKEDIGEKIILTGEDAKHIGRVLRMAVGDSLTVCDKEGTDYFCEIEEFTKETVTLKIVRSEACQSELKVKLSLYQCVPKAGKMDSIIQKATELGVCEIVPVISKRCVAKGEKPERWQKIAFEAAKQCGRGIIPEVRSAISFAEAIEELKKKDLAFLPYENAEDGKIFYDETASSIGMIIGPEGGFEESEVCDAVSAGVKICTLGKRILRTETAGSAAIAVMVYLYE